MADFKVPSSVPQDLLLIQEIVGLAPTEKKEEKIVPPPPVDDDICSSDSEDETELVKAELLEESKIEKPPAEEVAVPEPSDSSSDESDEDSSESETEPGIKKIQTIDEDVDDDEDAAPVASVLQTKHEIAEGQITIPEVEEVEETEPLEKVGEIMSIIDRTVIVRGLPSEILNRGNERALDSETLLVFGDRKVFGYIYETFGPTSQPLYQVKFNSSYPLDPEKVTLGREVFHVPTRSRFVFVRAIKAIKGSDASNVHDEEPGEEELEFSDDEAEAAYRSRLKRKRAEGRGRSSSVSRQSTPNPTMMRDQELVDLDYLNRGPYDAISPYDIDFSQSGPSRPPPVRYDDPYADSYADTAVANDGPPHSRGQQQQQQRGRGRDRGRGRGRGGRGAGGGGGAERHLPPTVPQYSPQQPAFSPSQQPYPQTPQQGFQQPPQHMAAPMMPWGFNSSFQPSFPQQQQYTQQQYPQQQYSQQQYPQQQYPQHQFGMVPPGYPFTPSPVVQPHINPRFAAAWAMGGSMTSQTGAVNPAAEAAPPVVVRPAKLSTQNAGAQASVKSQQDPSAGPTPES